MHIIHLRKPIELFWLLLTALARSTWSAADGTVGTNYPDSSSSSFFSFLSPRALATLNNSCSGREADH